LTRVFFTDRDLGKSFPEALVAAGMAVERHDDLFPEDYADEKWLEYVGTNGRIAITHNKWIRYTPNQVAAVIRHRAALFVIVGSLPHHVMARHFTNTLPKVLAFLETHDPPFIAKVYQPSPTDLAENPDAPGSVVLWHPQPIKPGVLDASDDAGISP